MSETRITASAFKAKCLALLDEVASNGQELVITKRGKPVAKVTPVEPPPSLAGSVRYLVGDEDLLAPIPDSWDAVPDAA